MRKNILVVNDDGIEALGIHKLAEALSEVGNVYVCSPHVEQSASGHGITIGKLVYCDDAPFKEAKRALSMVGTPADCVKIGLQIFREGGVEMDMVFSGFNHGMNLGTDTLYSGTVSAAIEGAFCGLPSVAMSISSNFGNHKTPTNFDGGMELAKKFAASEMFQKRIAKDPNKLDINFIHANHVIFSVNLPDLPASEIKGIKVCPLSYRAYDEWFHEQEDEEGRGAYRYSGRPDVIGHATASESDIIANGLGYTTITPLKFDLTDYKKIETLRSELEGWHVHS